MDHMTKQTFKYNMHKNQTHISNFAKLAAVPAITKWHLL